jgi:hypothetical protein
VAKTPINQLLKNTGLWRASSIDCDFRKNRSSSFPELDRYLPGGGWPADGITELLHNQYGIGELRLLTPALAALTREQSRWLLLVRPPYIPYPPALEQAGLDLSRVIISQPKNPKDYLWVLEKAMTSRSCSAVIAWPDNILGKQVRRLQVASKEGNCWGILFRPEKMAAQTSPAELRIQLRPAASVKDNSALDVKILKRRGGWESDNIRVDFSDQLHRPMPNFSEMVIQNQVSKPAALPSEPQYPEARPVVYEYQ